MHIHIVKKMKKYENLAKSILEEIQGEDNIINIEHCMTRLRLTLKDESLVNEEKVKNLEGVLTVVKSGGQFQIAIGNHVKEVYEAVLEVSNFSKKAKNDEFKNTKKQKISEKFVDLVTGIFTPALGVLAAAGMLKGFLVALVSLGLVSDKSGTYQILYAASDGFFYFIPIILGYSASRKFKLDPFLGLGIAATLVYPNLVHLATSTEPPLFTVLTGTAFEAPVQLTFLKIPVILMNYTSSVIPIILTIAFASKVAAFFEKHLPKLIKSFFVPLLTLIIVVPVALIVIGPISIWTGVALGQGVLYIMGISPILAGLIMGGFWQVFVVFGLHWGFIPIMINNLVMMHMDPISAMIFPASFAQMGAVLAVFIKTKNDKYKSLSMPAFISGIFGVTEPAIYGVTLPLKKPFIISCVASAIAGGVMGLFKISEVAVAGLGIFEITAYIDPVTKDLFPLYVAIFTIVLAFVLSFGLTMVLFKDKVEEVEDVSETPHLNNENTTVSYTIKSPLKGETLPLEKVCDEAFSMGALGKGVAIIPQEGRVVSPVNGKITTLFPTKHAIGITSEENIEVLIHIGMDTVKLNGAHFTAYVQQGDYVKQGDLLIEFDIKEIKSKGYDISTPIVITNSHSYLDIIETNKNDIDYGDTVLTIIK